MSESPVKASINSSLLPLGWEILEGTVLRFKDNVGDVVEIRGFRAESKQPGRAAPPPFRRCRPPPC